MKGSGSPSRTRSDLDIAVLGVPFVSGAGFGPGPRFGPGHIREASRLVEMAGAGSVHDIDLTELRDRLRPNLED